MLQLYGKTLLLLSDIRVNEKRTFLSSLKSSSEKRALSMFARWGPVNTIGKDRNPIRSGYTPKTSDSIRYIHSPKFLASLVSEECILAPTKFLGKFVKNSSNFLYKEAQNAIFFAMR